MRKKACIVKRGSSWAVKQPLPDGRYRWQTVGPRKRDAELLCDEINRRVALGALYPSSPQTFAEFTEAWIERYSQRVRPATLASCRDSLKHLAVFDGWQIETIRAADIEDHVFAVARRAPRAAELMLDTLKMILRSARERGQTVDEAIFRVRPPRRERSEMRFLDWSEVERLACETIEPYGNLVRFACLTGLRQGELFALRDSAVDIERRSVLVEAGARDGQLVPTKTSAGRRQVRLSGEALRILREQLLARVPNALGLVFPTPGGSVWRKDNFMARIFRPAVRRAELAPLRSTTSATPTPLSWLPPAPIPSSSRRNSGTRRSTSRSTPTATSSPTPSPTSANPSIASWRPSDARQTGPISALAGEGPRDPRASR
jgi:integrase